MKKLLTIALAGTLSAGPILSAPLTMVYAKEETNQATSEKTISNSFELDIHTSKQDYLNALNDDKFFDGKTCENPLYDLLKEQIIKIAKGEGELTFTFDIDYSLTKRDIEEVLKQIVEDMEPYLYWSNGKGSYSYTEDEENSITFTFERNEDLFVSVDGIYYDGNGNQLIPWEDLDKHNLTLDELKLICGDTLVLIMDEDGEHILFVGGNFTTQKADNADEALAAIDCMKDLMGLKDNLSMVNSKTTSDPYGNIYYSFEAEVDQGLDKSKLIIVGVDQNGKVTCVTNSPQEAWENTDLKVTEIGEDEFAFFEDNYGYTFLDIEPEIVYYEPLNQYCYKYIIKTENNFARLYIGTIDDGDIVKPVFFKTLEEALDDSVNSYDFYFADEVVTDTMTFTDYFDNEVELPVAYDEEVGKYYFLDKERKIVGTASYDTYGDSATFNDLLEPYYFESKDDVNPIMVSAFHNMQNSFDSYKELNLFTTDKPVLVNFTPKNETENAWAKLYSDSIYINIYNHDVGANYDVVSHELTHAIQAIVSNESRYENANGAMMESYADICGNILEMLADDKDFFQDAKIDQETWLIGESAKTILRNMAVPEERGQPSYVYGNYFVMNTNYPNKTTNDHGGVHGNSGILNNIAYRMYKEAGLKKDDVLTIFFLTEYLFNRHCDYKVVAGYVEFVMTQLKYSQDKIDEVKKIMDTANFNIYDTNKTWYTADFGDDVKKIIISFTDEIKTPENYVNLNILIDDNGKLIQIYDDIEGNFGTTLPEETEIMALQVRLMNNVGSIVAGNLYFESPITMEKNQTMMINQDDVATALYSGIYANYETVEAIQEAKSAIVELYKETMQVVLIKDDQSQAGCKLIIIHENENNDSDMTRISVNYSEELQGYDVLLNPNETYSFYSRSEDNNPLSSKEDVNVSDNSVIDITDETESPVISEEEAPIETEEVTTPVQEVVETVSDTVEV